MNSPRWITPDLLADAAAIVSARVVDGSDAGNPTLDIVLSNGATHRVQAADLTDDGRSTLAMDRRSEHIARALTRHARRRR